MGTGTAPEEGAALAVALLDEFRARRCLVLATTHHDRLKAYASTTPGVLNASVEFDEVRLAPTYRLRVGVPGGSSGIAIARRLGLPRRSWTRARADDAGSARSRRTDRLPASQPRRARKDAARTGRAVARDSKRNAARCAKSGSSASASASPNWNSASREALAKHERDWRARSKRCKDRELRAQLEKQSQRKRRAGALGGARRGRRRRGGAPLRIAAGPGRRPPRRGPPAPERTRTRSARPRARIFRAGGAAAARRHQRRGRGRSAAHEGAAARDHRHRQRKAPRRRG